MARDRLPFPLLSDREGAVRRRCGVPRTLRLLPGRATSVLDREGVVRHILNAQFAAGRHVDEALRALRHIAGITGQ